MPQSSMIVRNTVQKPLVILADLWFQCSISVPLAELNFHRGNTNAMIANSLQIPKLLAESRPKTMSLYRMPNSKGSSKNRIQSANSLLLQTHAINQSQCNNICWDLRITGVSWIQLNSNLVASFWPWNKIRMGNTCHFRRKVSNSRVN